MGTKSKRKSSVKGGGNNKSNDANANNGSNLSTFAYGCEVCLKRFPDLSISRRVANVMGYCTVPLRIRGKWR
jgi:hypothetical protein